MRYAVVIEKAEGNYSAYVPDLPGCVATGATVAEVEAQIGEAIAFHVEGMREDGLSVPEPQSQVEYVEVGASRKMKAGKFALRHLFASPSAVQRFSVRRLHSARP